MDMLRNRLMVLRMIGVHDKHGIGKRNAEETRLLEFCDVKELCVANTWSEKEQKKQPTVWGEMKLRLIFSWLIKTIESIQKT